MSNVLELLPCPFCGNRYVAFKQRPVNGAWNVECPSCWARGPLVHISKYGGFYEENKKAKSTAGDMWNNKRTAEAIKQWMEENG